MKSIYINTVWLLLAVLCVGITGCKKELEPIVAKGKPAYISLSTKALNLGIAGNQINSVRVILINPDANHIVHLNVFASSPIVPLIIPANTGTYDVYVVANEEPNGLENEALSNVYNLPTLHAVNIGFSLDNRNLTNVPMFGVVENVTITAPASGESSPTNLASVAIGGVDHGKKLPVELDRVASKINIKVVSKNKVLQSANIVSAPNRIPLFGDVLLSTVTKQTKSIAPNLFTLTESSTDQARHILECKDVLIPSWTFAPATNRSNAMLFEFTTPAGETLSTELGHLVSEVTKDYTIKRNHNYEITITVIDKMIFTVVTIKPWISVDDNFDVL